MTPAFTSFEDEFTRIINRPDKYMPEIWHRQTERVKVGTHFFGLLNLYEYRYTEWKMEELK